MNIADFMKKDGELPLDNLVSDGGLARIFRKVGCIGDSLSSGEFETLEDGERGYHDMYEYSWGQFMAREAGFEVINFSQGGLTAKEFLNIADAKWRFTASENLCQAYIIALGVNDIKADKIDEILGSIDDVHPGLRSANTDNFAGNFAKIIQIIKAKQPKAKIFLMTMPKTDDETHNRIAKCHASLLYDLSNTFKNTYIIDLYKYAPIYDEEFKKNFFLKGHMNPQGYVLTAKMTLSYIDYIIRNNPEDFATIPFIDKPFYN